MDGLGFVRNFRFRLAHLAAILFVVGESLIGMVCPLTLLEDSLRRTATGSNFIQRWLHRILFYDVPEWMLTMSMCCLHPGRRYFQIVSAAPSQASFPLRSDLFYDH